MEAKTTGICQKNPGSNLKKFPFTKFEMVQDNLNIKNTVIISIEGQKT